MAETSGSEGKRLWMPSNVWRASRRSPEKANEENRGRLGQLERTRGGRKVKVEAHHSRSATVPDTPRQSDSEKSSQPRRTTSWLLGSGSERGRLERARSVR